MYNLYQVQLETKERIYSLEIPTNNYNAIELAEIYLAIHYNEYGPFHIGGYDNIGKSKTDTIIDKTRNRFKK